MSQTEHYPGSYARFTGAAAVGFAKFLDEKYKNEIPRDAQQKQLYTFPEMQVGRKLDKRQGITRWHEFISDLKDVRGGQNRRVGHPIDVARLMCTYFTSAEMNTMMTQRYSRDAREENPCVRRNRALRVASWLNNTIERMQCTKAEADVYYLWQESADLKQRVDDPDFISSAFENDAHTDVNQSLWAPARIPVGQIDAKGLQKIAVYLNDAHHVLAREREELLDIMASKKDGLSFNTSVVESNWRPNLEIFETHPQLVLPGREVTIPGAPIEAPFKEPHAYLK
jgi:hypothetical protein